MVETKDGGLIGFFANCIITILGITKREIDEEELVLFIEKKTRLSRKDINDVLDYELEFLKIKGIAKE
ncbi:MAG TPA: hypothetical protein VIK72_13440 [Clostridiaceae bacterium]